MPSRTQPTGVPAAVLTGGPEGGRFPPPAFLPGAPVPAHPAHGSSSLSLPSSLSPDGTRPRWTHCDLTKGHLEAEGQTSQVPPVSKRHSGPRGGFAPPPAPARPRAALPGASAQRRGRMEAPRYPHSRPLSARPSPNFFSPHEISLPALPLFGQVPLGQAAAAPPAPVPAPRRLEWSQARPAPPYLRSRPAAAPGRPAARSEPAPPPVRAWPTSSTAAAARLNRARRRLQVPDARRSSPLAGGPAPAHTPRPHWTTPARAQTGGSTLPFLIGW